MSESFDLGELLRNPEEILAAQREELAKAEALQQRIGEITGSATSEDERIKVSFSEGAGLTDLSFDPRVMRMASEDLAAEITRLVNAAREDAQKQIQVVLAEILGEDGQPSAEAFGKQVGELQESLSGLMQDTMRMDGELTDYLDRMRKLAEEQ